MEELIKDSFPSHSLFGPPHAGTHTHLVGNSIFPLYTFIQEMVVSMQTVVPSDISGAQKMISLGIVRENRLRSKKVRNPSAVESCPQ